MRVFFGKFSKSGTEEDFFNKQVEEKRYYSNKGSSWFGDINVGDYCYIIAGDKIFLWKAKEYTDEYLQFESVIENELPIDGNKFRSFKYFKFNPQFIVLTTRKARNRAFFHINYTEDFTENILKKSETYTQDSNFRKLYVVDEQSEKNEKDIYLIKNENRYSLHPSAFIEQSVIDSFRDNTENKGTSGQTRSNKDTTINKIVNAQIGLPIDDVSLLAFYDLFFNEYKTKTTEEKIEEEVDEKELNQKMDENNKKLVLNQILYGPPGTGKTFMTIDKALEIIYGCKSEELQNKIKNDSSLSDEIKNESVERTQLKKAFDYYKDEAKQIVFTTFHQSFGYEEFVEGIKPCGLDSKCDDNIGGEIRYVVQDGILKSICKIAQEKNYKNNNGIEFSTDSKVWKISLGGSGKDHQVKQDCFENGLIRIGWSSVETINDNEYKKLGAKVKNTINSFFNEMQIGDFVVSLGNQKNADAIGIIDGDYDRDDYEHYPHKRKVRWLKKDVQLDIFSINGNKNMVQQAVYRLNRISPEILINKFGLNEFTIQEDNASKNYVLIIDEINRGNISKIFGELITLIEDSKRIGKSEEIRVTLPYSRDDFGVPENLYIIGTMNTADRSIAPIDTALRRRFVFEEMSPKADLLKQKVVVDNKNNTGINLEQLLEAINARIEYLYDRDHTIGHAYLIDVKTLEGLKFAFKNKIIPLLAEYFYEDWVNIDLVLNNNGFIESNESSTYLSKIKSKVNGKKVYTITKCEAWTSDMFKKIYDDKALDKSQVQTNTEPNDAE